MKSYTVKLSIEDDEGVVQYESKMTKDFIDNLRLQNNNSPLDEIYVFMQQLMKANENRFKLDK